jgi:putative ABC transport system permease protein
MAGLGAVLLDDITFVVQSHHNQISEASIRAALARADSRVAAATMESLDDMASRSRTTERFIFVLVSAFGVLGLILAAVGLYGLLSLQVARRYREFGIRAALGATARQIIELVLRQGVTLLSVGFAAGAVVTGTIVRFVQSSWTGMPAPNFLAWSGAALVLGTAVVIACWLPARRASRIDPVIALRAE